MLPPHPDTLSQPGRLLEFRGAGQLLVLSSDESAAFRCAVAFAMWWPAKIAGISDLDDLMDTFCAVHVHGNVDFNLLNELAWEGCAVIRAEKITPRTVAKRLGLNYERTQITPGLAWLGGLTDDELGGYLMLGHHALLFEIVISDEYETLVPLIGEKKLRLPENMLDSLDI